MNKNTQHKNFYNRYRNYYKSNITLLLITIIIAALLAITSQAAVNTPEGTDVEVQFGYEGVNITFANVTKSGNTSVDTSSTGPDMPGGYDLAGEYRNITTTAKYTGNTSVCIEYSDTKIANESALKLFHYKTGENESIVYVQTGINAVDSIWDLSSPTHPSLLYYNFEEGEGDENLHVVINGQDYSINGSNDNLLYNTSIYYNANNDAQIAWLSKQYSVIDCGIDWNISKVLTDENEDDTHLIEVGESLSLPEGFAITPLEIGDNGINTLISITQNGDEVYNLTVNKNELFVYKKDLNASGEDDNWVLRFNVETVFDGMYSDLVKINKTQLISPDIVTIRTPDSDLIPNYNITSQESNTGLQIKLNQTSDTIQFYKDSTVSFLDNSFHFRINEDGDTGGFVAKRSELGTHEIFTQVQFNISEGDTTWDFTSATHPGILYYDFDEEIGDENLHFVINGSNYEIEGDGNFLYNTTIYLNNGNPFIAWLGKPCLVIENGSDWYITEVLIDEDMDDTHLIGIDKNLSLPEGFAITLLGLDYERKKVWILITQNGEEVCDSVIKEGKQLIYKKDLNQSGTDDNWVLRFNLERIYSINDSIRINSTQLISPDVLNIRTPNYDIISGFEITSDMSYNTLQVAFDDDDDYIVFNKGETTGFLNDAFHFRINDYDTGGIYSTMKVAKTWTDVTESLDTDTNTICGNVTTLSEFIIAGQNIFDIIAPSAVISEPEEGACISGTVNINGTASDTYFKNYTVEWRNDTSGWIEINTSTQKVPAGISCRSKINTLTQKGLSEESADSSPAAGVSMGILTSWDTTVLKDGSYMIRLTVVDNVSNINTDTVNVTIDNTLPEVNITEPVKNTIRFVDNIVKGTVTDTNIQSAELIVSTDAHIPLSYDLDISNNMFRKRVEYFPGKNNTLNLIATDKAGNSNNTSIIVMVGNSTFVQTEPTVNKSETVIVNAIDETDVQIEFTPNVSRTNVTFTLTAITNKTAMDILNISAFDESDEMAIGKMVEINVEGLDATNVSEVESVIVKMYYNTSDLDLDGDGTIETGEWDEDNLFIWYNSTNSTNDNWTKLLKNDPGWVINSGQIKISGNNPGYIWVKIRHLSKFALTALPITSSKDTNGNGDSDGSSSSGGGASGEARENIVITETEREYVYKDVDVCYSYDSEGNIVQYINFKGLINAGRVSAKIEILKDTSTLVDNNPPNKVYKNLNIFIGNSGWATSSNIANATINFTVEKSWITNEKIDKSSIKMYKYSSGKWNELSTSYINEDADCLYFKSETPGFSSFAIAGEQVSSGETDTDDDSIITSSTDGDKDTTDQMPSAEKTDIPGFCVSTSLLVIMMMAWLLRKK